YFNTKVNIIYIYIYIYIINQCTELLRNEEK
ncbi:MAG: hypothetical protein ACI8RD_010182, partial [Bacillariaceae sp.]